VWGHRLTVTTKLFTTENDGLKPGEHVYSNATTEEGTCAHLCLPSTGCFKRWIALGDG
jgi:hypothetical protein